MVESKVILLVDGEDRSRQVCSDSLASTGHTILETDNLMEALLITAERRGAVDILLIALSLSGVDELAEAFALLWPRVEVVYLAENAESAGSSANRKVIHKAAMRELLLSAALSPVSA